jgi:hypothetical protein
VGRVKGKKGFRLLFRESFCCVAGSGGPKGAFALMGLHLLVVTGETREI